MKVLKANCGTEIKEGMVVKHIHHGQKVKVCNVEGVLYGGTIKISAYDSSVIEIVSK